MAHIAERSRYLPDTKTYFYDWRNIILLSHFSIFVIYSNLLYGVAFMFVWSITFVVISSMARCYILMGSSLIYNSFHKNGFLTGGGGVIFKLKLLPHLIIYLHRLDILPFFYSLRQIHHTKRDLYLTDLEIRNQKSEIRKEKNSEIRNPPCPSSKFFWYIFKKHLRFFLYLCNSFRFFQSIEIIMGIKISVLKPWVKKCQIRKRKNPFFKVF